MTAFDTAWDLLKMAQFPQLPKTTQDDIIYILGDKNVGNPSVREFRRKTDYESYERIMRQHLSNINFKDPSYVLIDNLKNQRPIDHHWMDDDLVEEYARRDMDDVPPILISGNNFVDGGHRLHSHKRAGEPTIFALDIEDLLERPLEGLK